MISKEIEPSSDVQFSRLRTQLSQVSEKVSKSPQLHNHPFLKVLVNAAQPDPIPISGIYRYCCETDPTILLWEISEAMKQANINEKEPGVDLVFDLVGLMCMFAGARWISQKEIGRTYWINGLPSMVMTEELTAALVAATWFDLGLKLRFSADGNIEITNLINDRAETQFGVKTVELAFVDEVYFRLKGERFSINDEPHEDDIKAGIKIFERKNGAGLMVGLSSSDARKGVDAELRNRFKQYWGIEMFIYGDAESQPSETVRNEWIKMQTSLMRHFKSSLTPLFQGVSTSIVSHPPGGNSVPRSKVFISYAHARLDKNRLIELVEHLKVLENQGLVDIWDDRKIGAGQDWYDQIDQQLKSCQVAVFLVSPAFLGSTFITNTEVPTLLSQHQQQGMHVVPLLIRDCTWEVVPWLKAMQMRPPEAKPLSNTPRKRDQQLKQVALEIAGFCS